MFNSVVLDVVIGLLFIYLLYSLFVTIVSELVATLLNLRARNMKEAIDRMLNDEKPIKWWQRFADTMNFTKNPKNEIVNTFYNHSEIKYLGSSGVFKSPSSFKATNFSKTLMELLAGKDPIIKKTMDNRFKADILVFSYDQEKENHFIPKKGKCWKEFILFLKKCYEYIFKNKQYRLKKAKSQIRSVWQKSNNNVNEFITELNNLDKSRGKKTFSKIVKNILDLNEKLKDDEQFKSEFIMWIDQPRPGQIDPNTAEYIRNLWKDSQGDMQKFKLLLEQWFDRTMGFTIEWYKRKITVITFVLGFLLALFFNADTFVMVKNLSIDKDARDKMVSMANAYVQNNKFEIDTSKIQSATELEDFNKRLDSLLVIKDQLQADMNSANSILGLGGFPPDSVQVILKEEIVKTGSKPDQVKTDTVKTVIAYKPPVDMKTMKRFNIEEKDGWIVFTGRDKFRYLWWLFYYHFFGFLVTAIAISLGAPFWFDLLNKIMGLKTSQTEEPKKKKGSEETSAVSPINRVG